MTTAAIWHCRYYAEQARWWWPLPCLDDINVLLSYSTKRNTLLPDTQTISEVNSELSMSFWNGLLVHKDTPQDIRDRITTIAEKSMMSEKAQQIATDSGALVYWLDADGSEALIESDRTALELIDACCSNEKA